jgi:hypothetical protein
VYDTWTVQYLASKSIKHLHICKCCTFSKSAIFIYIRTHSFAVHTKYCITSVIFSNNKRVGSSNYLIVRSARKPCFHIIMAQTCPQLPYMAQKCPQNILSRPLWCHKIPPARNDLNRSRGTEPRQLIGLASDNAHFNPTLLILVKIIDVIQYFVWTAKEWVLM